MMPPRHCLSERLMSCIWVRAMPQNGEPTIRRKASDFSGLGRCSDLPRCPVIDHKYPGDLDRLPPSMQRIRRIDRLCSPMPTAAISSNGQELRILSGNWFQPIHANFPTIYHKSIAKKCFSHHLCTLGDRQWTRCLLLCVQE